MIRELASPVPDTDDLELLIFVPYRRGVRIQEDIANEAYGTEAFVVSIPCIDILARRLIYLSSAAVLLFLQKPSHPRLEHLPVLQPHNLYI